MATYDVFLSYSAADRAAATDLAEGLRNRGLRVWFDAWDIAPGDSIPAKIDAGLEASATLVLCMSAAAFASEWAALEAHTFRFRDPLSKQRRFIPVRLDDAEPPGSLAQLRYVDWRHRTPHALEQIAAACGARPDVGTAPDERTAFIEVERPVSLGHTDWVRAVAALPDGRVVSGADDATVRVWDVAAGTCIAVLEGHTGWVHAVAALPDGRVVSGAGDDTVRVWDVASGSCQAVIERHGSAVQAVAWVPRVARLVSAGSNGVLRMYELTNADCGAGEEATRYTNAKVLLVGESNAGKSGLALRLAERRWEPTDSTLGAWATQLAVPMEHAVPGDDREIWLWDFGGQADQRLVHQLYMGDTALALLVFDGQRDDTMIRLWDWVRALGAAGATMKKILVAGRTDLYPVRLSGDTVTQFTKAAGFVSYFETSAKDDLGCDELREAIVESIDWDALPWHSSPAVFRRLKQAILTMKDSGRVLVSAKELRDWLPLTVGPFEPAELDAVLRLLAGPGAVLPLEFGDWVLLRPDVVNSYAQAVIRTLRDDPEERGCIAEERVLRGDDLAYPEGFDRLPGPEETVVLRAMTKLLTERGICLRDESGEHHPALLVFPSYFRRERPARPDDPDVFVTYRFRGYLDGVYASLVSRLHYSDAFQSAELWRYAADFTTHSGSGIGIRLAAMPDGSGELDVYCDRGVQLQERVVFVRYVHEHLLAHCEQIERLRTLRCPVCHAAVHDRDAARRRLLANLTDIVCQHCERRVPLWDEMEELFADPAVREEVARIRREAQDAVDNEARGQILVGNVIAVVSSANQIAREIHRDQGLDVEVEFKDDAGQATGKRVYLQLKSGDSHLRSRKRDESRVFRIDKPRHADYWAEQPAPVMLVVRDSAGSIEWMEIGEYLRAEREAGRWPVTEIRFRGEPFDVVAVRRWRDRALADGSGAPAR